MSTPRIYLDHINAAPCGISALSRSIQLDPADAAVTARCDAAAAAEIAVVPFWPDHLDGAGGTCLPGPRVILPVDGETDMGIILTYDGGPKPIGSNRRYLPRGDDVMLAPRALGLLLYREHENGFSVDELSAALQLPPRWIEERIEAARLCLEKQVRVEWAPTGRPRRSARSRTNIVSIGSAKRRRSR